MTGTWTAYYEATGDDPRKTLLDALDRFDEPGFAVDLGSGTGRDTVELVRRGWRVLAIDAEAEAFERLAKRDDLDQTQVSTQLARFEDAEWTNADLVNASFSLPFVPAGRLADVWDHIVASLLPGGRFCGQLFGDRDTWASEPGVTCHTREQVTALLAPLEIEQLDELEEDSADAGGTPKHWHVFHIVARKRQAAAAARTASS